LQKQRFKKAKNSFKQLLPQEGILWTNNAKGEMEGEQLVSPTGQTYEEYQGYGWTNAVHPDDTQPTVDGMRQ
jgi:hypothetical protein